MSPGASAVGKTFRLLAVGVAAGIVTSLAALFPIYTLRGNPEAITVPPLWVAGAWVGTLVGGLALPLLGWSVLRQVPPRRIALVVGAATWAGAVLFSLLNSTVVGAFTSALAAVTWLAVARPGSARGQTS